VCSICFVSRGTARSAVLNVSFITLIVDRDFVRKLLLSIYIVLKTF
jgi:hypothetical protein